MRPDSRLSSVTCSVDVGKSPDIPYVYVTHDGLVRNYKPIQVVTACTLNIYNFPFDVQKCSLTFQSWLHTSKTSCRFKQRTWFSFRLMMETGFRDLVTWCRLQLRLIELLLICN